MRSFIAIAGLIAVVAATSPAPAPAKTVTVTEDVTVTACEAVVTDCGDWEDVPSDETTTVVTATWEDVVDPEPTVSGTKWADAPVDPVASTLVSSWVDAPAPTPVAPAEGASTWVDAPAPVASTAKPVASYEPAKPVSPDTYTGAASKMAGAGVAGVVALAALLL